MMRTLSTVALTALLPLLSGCAKEPGVGGKAEIRGYVLRQDINNNTGQPIGDPYPYPEARVYVVYGDHDFYDDDIRTGPDGLFVFSWLRKGDYKVYTYGECDPLSPDCSSGVVAVSRSVQISDKSEVVTVPTLTANNW
jgi:hypothetical protein